MGYGVSACATCDGAFFKDKDVVVVGGGDTAMEEATFLTRFATKVDVIHRRGDLRASKIMQERARKNPKIEFIWNSAIDDYPRRPRRTASPASRLKDTKTGATSAIIRPMASSSRLAISRTSQLFKGQLDMDEVGYLKTQPGSTYTNIPGVFAAGDVADSVYRQAVTAAGTGCMAAIDAERWLEANYPD